MYVVKVPMRTLGILHICNIWILLKTILVIRRKVHLPALFCIQSWLFCYLACPPPPPFQSAPRYEAANRGKINGF